MAQFKGPRQTASDMPSGSESPQGPAAANRDHDDHTWFDSSWQLRKGLDVAELTVSPEGWAAFGSEPFNPRASGR